LAATRFH
jgi:hypothetical protein